MSYGGWQEDMKDAADADHRNAMVRIIDEFNKRGHAITERDLTDIMKAAKVLCFIETASSKVGFGDLQAPYRR